MKRHLTCPKCGSRQIGTQYGSATYLRLQACIDAECKWYSEYVLDPNDFALERARFRLISAIKKYIIRTLANERLDIRRKLWRYENG